MCDTGYSVKRLAEDLRGLRDRFTLSPALPQGGGSAFLEEVRECVKRLLLMKHNWLRGSMCVPGEDPTSPGIHRLHEEPDHSLAVFVIARAPGSETAPHDHGTWAVIAGLDGWETQHRWKRLDDGSMVRDGSERIDARAIIAMESGAIHSVHNDSGAVAVTLSVYGMDPEYTKSTFEEAS